MDNPMKDKLRQAMKDEAAGMIDKDFDEIFDAYHKSLVEAEPGVKFKYPVSLTVTLAPNGNDVRVMGGVRAPVPAFTDKSAGRIVTPEADMFED